MKIAQCRLSKQGIYNVHRLTECVSVQRMSVAAYYSGDAGSEKFKCILSTPMGSFEIKAERKRFL